MTKPKCVMLYKGRRLVLNSDELFWLGFGIGFAATASPLFNDGLHRLLKKLVRFFK